MITHVFIYALSDPRNAEIRYVGKSRNPKARLVEHICHAKTKNTPPRHVWINGLLKLGLKPKLLILEECSVSKWKEREIFWISKYNNLTNATKGGDGAGSRFGKENPFFGKRHTKTTKIKMSEAAKGRKHSFETKLKMVKSHLGKIHNQETKLKMSIWQKGKGKSDETKKKISKACLGRIPWNKGIKLR